MENAHKIYLTIMFVQYSPDASQATLPRIFFFPPSNSNSIEVHFEGYNFVVTLPSTIHAISI